MTDPAPDPPLELLDYWTPVVMRLYVDAGVIGAFGREARTPHEVASATNSHRAPDAPLSNGVIPFRAVGR